MRPLLDGPCLRQLPEWDALRPGPGAAVEAAALSSPIPEIRWLGRTLRCWRGEWPAAYSTPAGQSDSSGRSHPAVLCLSVGRRTG